MSLRLRLTVLYSTILLVTLLAFGVALYVTVSQVTRTILSTALATEAQRILESPNFSLTSVAATTSKFAPVTTYVQTIDLDGEVLARTANLSEADVVLPISTTALKKLAYGETWTEEVKVEGGSLLVYTKPVKKNGHPTGAVQVARSFIDQDQALMTLRSVSIIAGGLVTLAAFGIGWLLSGFALRPITRLAETARQIGVSQDFSRRVEYHGPKDEVGQLVTTFNDMVGALQRSFQQLEHTLLTQRRFTADASHELRTPLTTIRGNLGLLQRVPPITPEDREAALGDAVEESERMMRLVNDLLTLARNDAGQHLRREPVPLGPLIEDVRRQMSLAAPHCAISSTGETNAVVRGDPDALRQILLILLDNACKFTPPDGTVAIHTEREPCGIVLAVRDTGVGISAEALPHIFERFYRAETSRTSAGTGLGLAIAKTLAEAQNGTIRVASTPGQGSTFTLTLPTA